MFDTSIAISNWSLEKRCYIGQHFEMQNGIRSIVDLFTLLSDWSDNVGKSHKRIWFRGESKKYQYPAISSFGRAFIDKIVTPNLPAYEGKYQTSCLTNEEIEIIDSFKNESPKDDLFYKLNEGNDNSPDWFAFAQHRGNPTRLLDVTGNPLVALYFACNSYVKNDGYLFIYLDVWQPKKKFKNYQELFDLTLDSSLVAYRNENRLEEYFRNNNSITYHQQYFLFESPVLNEQLYAQQGSFLLRYDPFQPMSDQCIVFKVDQNFKERILKELKQIGIDKNGLKVQDK